MSIKSRLTQAEKQAVGGDGQGGIHGHVEIVGEGGAVVASFCGREAGHGQGCGGAPDVLLKLPDNGRGDVF